MASGGARNRSGPQADPRSGRSDRRGLKFNQIPASGWGGAVPEFPLPKMDRFRKETDEDGRTVEVFDAKLTKATRERELAVWADAWTTPQAAMWSVESWRWQTIAEYCRLKTVTEGRPDSNASLVGQLHRFRDQIGLTPAGLRENGWEIVKDELDERRNAAASSEEVESPAPVRRLRG